MHVGSFLRSGVSVKRYGTAIVVDRSSVARRLLAEHLRAHCDHVLAVGEFCDLRAELGVHVSLVVIDSTADGAMDWLEEASRQRQRPAVLVVTHTPSRQEEIRATLLGAIGYLAKPVSSDQIASALAPATA
jgi:DNA-binding response OmpR family regulator